MSPCFADTFYFIAILSGEDAAHQAALDFTSSFAGEIYTTHWIFTELADGFADMRLRQKAIDLIAHVLENPQFIIVPAMEDLFSEAWHLYETRLDKSWSLTDCSSFVVMKHHSILNALTADRHFEQAGFVALLK